MNKFTIDIDETFKYHYRSLCLYVLHYVHDTDIAEDIVQDSFSALWEKLSISGAEIENVKAYLYTTARNRSLDYLKKEEIYDPNLSPSDFEDTLSDEEAEERSVREARMWTAIDALPERCREIFLLNKRDGMKYKDIADAVQKYTVFGRVIPEQKKKIIEAFKMAGNVVAMTGDGVNDVLALKCADCSVAMASGSEAASNAAQIVLLDSDFSKMPDVVGEGRRVVNNIKRSASLFLAKNIFSMLLTIFTLISVNLYPLYPTQLSFLGIFTIGVPAFFLALQPNKSLIKGDFLLNVVLKALPTGLTDFIVVTIITIYGNCTGAPHEQTATAATLVLLTVGMAALVRVCKPFDIIRVCVCVAMACGIVFSMIFLRSLFAMVVLKGLALNLTVMMMVLSLPLYRYVCRMTAWLIDFFENHNRHFRHLLKG